ncbi:Alpha/Beta hydrolase protein [Xylariales sp. PMI_506]|nr:Alpha/Beta hydrolase protein [Xylariales sp. PMI_506]
MAIEALRKSVSRHKYTLAGTDFILSEQFLFSVKMHWRASFLAIATISTVIAAPADTTNSSVPLGYTKNGTYAGFAQPELGTEAFLGIPFALAPRLHLPQPLNETWTGTRNATQFGLTCPAFGNQNLYGWEIGEDCLNFNLVRPSGAYPGQSLPVMVWIFGGGFYQGSNHDPEFNASYLVRTSVELGQPVIGITINTRLSGFGFLNSEDAIRQGVANLGLRDVWKVLEWIQENVDGFGGDKNRVTVFGQSSGGLTVEMLAMAYSGNHQGLFARGITSSITLFSPFWGTVARQQSMYTSLLNETGCTYANDRMQCLRDLDLETFNSSLYAVESGKGWRPIVDGDFLKNSPFYQFANQQIAPVSLLVGCNSDEGLSTFQTSDNTTEELAASLAATMGLNATMAQELLALYPEDPADGEFYPDEGPTYPPYSQPMDLDWVNLTAAAGVASGNMTRRGYAMGGDWSAMSGRRLTAQGWHNATGGAASVYSYRFDTDVSRFPLSDADGGLGFAMHGADLSYDFGLPDDGSVYTPNKPLLDSVPALRNVSLAVQATWISFAATGSPNHHGLGSWVPHWPEYTASGQNFVFNGTIGDTLNLHVEDDDFRKDQIQWWMDHWGYLIMQGFGG